MNQHTPGPWKVKETKDRTLYIETGITEDRRPENQWRSSLVTYYIARLTGSAVVGPERIVAYANAHLIAKAPEMYSNLKTDIENMNTLIDSLNWLNDNDIRIAKAICMQIQQRNNDLLREIEEGEAMVNGTATP